MCNISQAMLLPVFFIWVCGVFCEFSDDERQEQLYTVNILFHKIQDLQVQKSKESNSPFTPTRYQGTYESEWRLNVHEPTDASDQSAFFSVKDTDIYVNTWITMILLDAYVYGKAPKPTEMQLRMSIDSIAEFRDRNVNISNSRMTMWPQKYYTALKTWISAPVNLMRLAEFTTCINWEQLSREPAVRDLQVLIRRLTFSKAPYDVHPDFESTFMNIGLGSLLHSMEGHFVGAYDTWTSHFVNVTSVMTSLKDHAYRPFSSIQQATNVVDPKTYFFLRRFLEAAKEEGKDVLLIPIWILENEIYGKGMSLATRHMKTIDVTTSASVLFGLTNMILTGMVSYDVLDDPDVEKIYRNTSSMLTFQIRTNFYGRPDLALTYHPSEFQFYWSVSRTLLILRRHMIRHGLLHQALVAVMLELKVVLQDHCTARIMSAATSVGPDQVYFEEYRISRETRLFSTAMAMNTILFSWTVFDEGSGYLVWEEYTPAEVRVTMERAARWLNRFILGERYRPGNELLSWQQRGIHRTTFPANVCLYENGTTSPITARFPCDDPLTATRAIQGVVPADWYQYQLQKGTTIDNGEGDSTNEIHVWSSEALTYATSMFALSCHHNSIEYDEAYRRT